MEWLLDPTIWVGLFTLVILEIVLGIDNLIFIAILADKLPPEDRDRARIIGLSLALIMRLGLLAGMSWLVQLKQPWISFAGFDFSGRDLILMFGGFFLLFKGTLELHERLEGDRNRQSVARVYADFWVIVTQIVVLDAVFSLDAVITAVGMVDHLFVMMLAVVIAVGIMLLASKPLTRFVNSHPTVVILCLGFLLMIGFSLVAESFGYKVPKGYLYAAIGFSVLIELLNQIARFQGVRLEAKRPMRERTAEAVLRMLGKKLPEEMIDSTTVAKGDLPEVTFGVEERNMVSGVLTLAERSIHSVMTPRMDVSWVNLDDDPQEIQKQIASTPHSFFPVCRESLDNVQGIGRAKDMIADLIMHGHIRKASLREPILVHDTISIIRLMDTLKKSRGQLVLVADEFGAIQGLVTPIDVFEAIAGEFPDEDETPDIVIDGDRQWTVDGAADLHHLEQVLETEGLVDEDEDFTTLAGYLLSRFGQLPKSGDICEFVGPHATFKFEVKKIDGRRIAQVQIQKLDTMPDDLHPADHI